MDLAKKGVWKEGPKMLEARCEAASSFSAGTIIYFQILLIAIRCKSSFIFSSAFPIGKVAVCDARFRM